MILGRRVTDTPVKVFNALEKRLTAKVTETIEKTVNGKVEGMRTELRAYIEKDVAWKEEDAKWKKEQEGKTGPVVESYRRGSDFFIVLKAIIGFLVLVGGGILAWVTIRSKIL